MNGETFLRVWVVLMVSLSTRVKKGFVAAPCSFQFEFVPALYIQLTNSNLPEDSRVPGKPVQTVHRERAYVFISHVMSRLCAIGGVLWAQECVCFSDI